MIVLNLKDSNLGIATVVFLLICNNYFEFSLIKLGVYLLDDGKISEDSQAYYFY